MSPPIHHIEFFVQHCEMRALLNGVPIAAITAITEHTEHFAPPINPFLIGDGNVVEVSIRPARREDGTLTEWSEAKVELAVRTFGKDGIVVPGGGGPAITTADFTAELAERIEEAREAEEELEEPQDFFHVFHNEAVSFASELVEADPFDDRAALIGYALHIRDLFARRDLDGFLEEVDAKCQVWSLAYDEPAQVFRDSIRSGLAGEFLPAGPVTDFGEDDIELLSIAGGRLWGLRRTGGLPLIQTPPDAEGGFMSFEIVVGVRDGRLRVVR
jgi:hypothetical protein